MMRPSSMCSVLGWTLLVLALRDWAPPSAAAADDHDEGDAHHEEMPEVVHFTRSQRKALGIVAAVSRPGRVAIQLRLVGEVRPNADRTAHVTSRVAGVVTQIRRTLGDRVARGEVLAVLESRELAAARADFLTARARAGLAQTTYTREETLWHEQISSERQYLDARQALAEARIAFRAAEQKLHALGVRHAELDSLPDDPSDIAQYRLVSPIAGSVIDRHVTVGEVLSAADPAFLVVDLSTVWVELSVHLQDLGRVREGQHTLVIGNGEVGSAGTITYLSQTLDRDTRTACARVVIDNDGAWLPGTPVHALVTVDAVDAAVTVPRTAVYDVEGSSCVFLDADDGIRLREVVVARIDEERAQIAAGLAPGERVISGGGVHVKAAFLRSRVGGHDH